MAVAKYLIEGLPQDTLPDENQAVARLPAIRWELYRDCAAVLGEQKEFAASLVSVLTAPLPEPLMNDLLVNTALSKFENPSWQDWDRAVAKEMMLLRRACAVALVVTDKLAAGDSLVTAINREKAAVETAMCDDQDQYFYVHMYAAICSSAARAGRIEGIDSLADLLPLANGRNSGNVRAILMYLIDAPYVLNDGMPEGEYQKIVRKWQKWWSAHRESFTLPSETELQARRHPVMKLVSLRDYLDASNRIKGYDDVIGSAYPQAEEWLRLHAQEHVDELRVTAEDSDEDVAIRETAARWYSTAGGDPAQEWLARQLLAGTASAGLSKKPLRPEVLFGIAARSSPTFAAEIATKSIEQTLPSARAAVLMLLNWNRFPTAPAFVLKHYSYVANEFPDTRSQILQAFRNHPFPGDVEVIVDCLMNGDPLTTAIAASIVQSRGIEEDLPDDARKTLEALRRDLLFQVRLIELVQDRETQHVEAARIAAEVTETNARAACIYARAYSLLTDAFTGPVTPEAEVCLTGIRRCIARYQLYCPAH